MKKENIILWAGVFLLFGVWIGGKFNSKKEDSSKMAQFFSYLQQEYVEELNIDSLQAEAMDHILSSLDPHSTYIPVEEGSAMAERMSGGFSGVGVEFAIKKDSLVFIHVLDEGPAAKAGILSGDRVFAIDGDTITGSSLTNEAVTSRIKGRRGTSVDLSIVRAGEQLNISVERDLVPIESVLHLELDDKVGYIKVDRFAETTHDEFTAHLDQLVQQGAASVIIDLRDNPGGYLHESVAMADEFLGENALIVSTKYKDGTVKSSRAMGGQRFEELPIHILINENSASASEVFSGALQDHDRAVIYGQTSFGKGLVQEDKRLDDGSKVRLTVAYYYTPSGRSIQKPYDTYKDRNDGVYLSDSGRVLYGGGGIEPDVVLEDDSTSYFWTFSFGTIDAFSYEYADTTRATWTSYSLEKFLDEFEPSPQMLQSFLDFGGYGLSVEDLSSRDERELRHLIEAGVARNLWGFDAYRKVLLLRDSDVRRVLISALADLEQ